MPTMIIHTCLQCGIQFSRRLENKEKIPQRVFCSRRCRDLSQVNQVLLSCVTCGTEFTRTPSQKNGNGKNKSDRNFCSRSCAVTYNNTHKTYGTRRSKLESYLEQQLRSEFPKLELICNGKDTIGSELDFYFPQLRLAIELNGIFHYEPIYGADKLERIHANDQQKYAACNAAGVELCVIDANVKHVTANVKERYWSIVRDLVTPLLGRASSANVQAL